MSANAFLMKVFILLETGQSTTENQEEILRYNKIKYLPVRWRARFSPFAYVHIYVCFSFQFFFFFYKISGKIHLKFCRITIFNFLWYLPSSLSDKMDKCVQ